MSPSASRRSVKLLHTVVWAFFAGCILLIPVYAWRGDLRAAVILIAIVSGEVAIILANRWRCPLTGVAARPATYEASSTRRRRATAPGIAASPTPP